MKRVVTSTRRFSFLMPALSDLAGTKVNSWTFVSYAGNGCWNVVCDCGTTAVKRTATITRTTGAIKSCGCAEPSRKERNALPYLGKVYGKLTVLERDSSKSSFSFICLCECGSKRSVVLSNLTSGRTVSCGCSKAERENGTMMSNGYRFVRVPEHPNANSRGYVLEHRVVMEGHIGRFLEPHENVHHINGVRCDNRLENLELWSTSQPCGQRVRDKIEWAKEILALYCDADGESLLDW